MSKKLFFFFLFFLFLIPISYASCCQIDNTQLVYFDLGDWEDAEIFCTNVGQANSLSTTFSEQTCGELNIQGCNGWSGNCNINIPLASQASQGVGGGAKKIQIIEQGCLESWQCNEYSECADNTQTRTCQDINKCNTTFNKPETERACGELLPGEKPILEESVIEEKSEEELQAITGRAVQDAGNIKAWVPVIIGVLIIIFLALALFINKRNTWRVKK